MVMLVCLSAALLCHRLPTQVLGPFGALMAPARPCQAALVCVSTHPAGNGELELVAALASHAHESQPFVYQRHCFTSCVQMGMADVVLNHGVIIYL